MRRILGWALLTLAFIGGTADAAVRAWLDNNHIGAGDTVQLTLQRDGETSAQPDLSPLKQDFDVISVGSSSNVQIVNGAVSSQTQAEVILSPKHAGQLTVPAITWGGQTSAPLSLSVGAATPGAAGTAGAGAGPAAGSPVFIETTVDIKSPYVQAAVNVTVRIYTTEQLVQASLEFPTDPDVLVQQVGGDTHGTVVKNGQQYDLVERHYVFFPQRSGALHIPGAVLAGQVPVRVRQDQFSDDPFANFFGAGGMSASMKPIRVHGDPIDLDVRPRPAASGSGAWLPAQGVSVSAAWHPTPASVHAGDPITVDLHIQADGLTAAQLPDLSSLLALPPGLKAYPDQAKLNNAAQGDLVTGSRDQSVALIADHPGRYVLPALHLSWWDTKADQQRVVDLPAQTLEVLPAPASAQTAASNPPVAGAAANAVPASATSPSAAAAAASWRELLRGDGRWIWVSAGLALLWLATMVAWWLSRRKPRAPAAAGGQPDVAAPAVAPSAAPQTGFSASRTGAPPAAAAAAREETAPAPAEPRAGASKARAKFQEACRGNDAAAARRWLLAWAGAAWPEAPPAGLGAFAKRCTDAALVAALADLERACYAGAEWRGESLASMLKELPKTPTHAGPRTPPIAPLYR